MSEENVSGKSIIPDNSDPDRKSYKTVSMADLYNEESKQHVYECEECNVGGELLLSCESCPCKYHLFCLNPPLEVVPEGQWFCPKCAREKCFSYPRKGRSKRVVKKTDPKKLTIHGNSVSKAPSTHDNLPNDPQQFSSHRPLLVRLKLGSKTLNVGSLNNSKERKPVKSKSSDSMRRKKKSMGDNSKSSDMKSMEDDNKGLDDNRSNSKKCDVVYKRKRQKYLPKLTQTSKKEERGNRILAESGHPSTGIDDQGLRVSKASCSNAVESREEEYDHRPAGRAGKEKYAIVRARKKERVAKRHVMVPSPCPPSVEEPQASENTTNFSQKDENTMAVVKPPNPNPIPSTEPISYPNQGLKYSPAHIQSLIPNEGKQTRFACPVLPSKRSFVPHFLRQPRPNGREALSEHSSFPVFVAPSAHAIPLIEGQQSMEPAVGPFTSFSSLRQKSGSSSKNVHQFHSNNTSRTAHFRRSAHTRPLSALSLQPSQIDKRLAPDFSFCQNPYMPAPLPMLESVPENHRVGNILFQAESDTSETVRERQKPDAWSEEELDSLWIGVRRYGCWNWDAILQDPKLTFSKYKTAVDLVAKWQQEQRKFSCEPSFNLSRSSEKPGLSDEMMARIHETRFGGLRIDAPYSISQSHPTNIELGTGENCFGFHPSRKTFVSGSSSACDEQNGNTGTDFLSKINNSNNEPNGNTASVSAKLNNLPHWLRDALSVAPSPPHIITASPALPPASPDAARLLSPLYGAENSAVPLPVSNVLNTPNLNCTSENLNRSSEEVLRIQRGKGIRPH